MKYVGFLILGVVIGLGSLSLFNNDDSDPRIITRSKRVVSFEAEQCSDGLKKLDCSVSEKRAKDVLSKAFLLFLANIGIQLNTAQKEKWKDVVERPKQFVSQSNQESTEQELESVKVVTSNDVLLESQESVVNAVNNIEQKRSFKHSKKFPRKVYRRSKLVKAGKIVIKKLNGSYQGEILSTNGAQELEKLYIV